MKTFDVAVVGGGPGGYTVAGRLGKMGKSVVLFEKKRLGGTCLHVGCVPTKLLQAAATRFYMAAKEGKDWGLETTGMTLNFGTIAARVAKTITILERGVDVMLKGANVTVVSGEAEVKAADLVLCGGEEYKVSTLILAQGSRPRRLDAFPIGERNVTTDELLASPRLPKSLLVVGGGVIGMEIASLYSQLGVKVRVGDVAPKILPNLDEEAAQLLLNSVRRLGVEVELGLSQVEPKDEELVLVAVGRVPNSDAPGLAGLGLKMEGARIAVGKRLRTSLSGVYAIGDLCAKLPYAHTAYEHARVVAADLAGKGEEMDDRKVPHVVFTAHPEIASVGYTESEAAAAGFEVKVVKHNWAANSKARILGEIQGWCKMVTDAKTGRVLGVHLAGPESTDLIGEACVLVGKGVTMEELEGYLHPHPTLTEIFTGH
jgi:dihydrolipoamide dehydrogenase